MSHKRFFRIWVFASILICGLLVGCGPSAEEQAATSVALTATAATDTPTPTLTPTPTDTPTPTATPVPYNLSLIVTGEEGVPIVGALVVLTEVGDEAGTQITDDVGQAFWYDIPGETVNLSINAQGYFPLDMTESIERGINHITVAPERDPHGLLPSEACAPGEIPLYIEDFQDGEAQGWQAIEFRAQGWDITPHPDSLGNIVLQNTGGKGNTHLQNHTFSDAVWRFEYLLTRRGTMDGGWSFVNVPYDNEKGEEVESSWYAFFMDPSEPSLNIVRCQFPDGCNLHLLNTRVRPALGNWHTVEIGTYKNELEFWIDGKRYLKYADPLPLMDGTTFLEPTIPLDEKDVVYFDNFSVCELTAPIGSTPTPES